MREEVLASVLANPRIQPELAIWGWQIMTYLFLGGVAAGIMVFSGWTILARKEAQAPFAANRAPLVGFVVLALGLLTLFLDLEHPINVWRFYASFEVTSPMSWGSWILLLVMPVLALLALAGLPDGFPGLYAWLCGLPVVGPRMVPALLDLVTARRRLLAALSIFLGAALGIYTGVLLSGFNARPFWHSALLGPLFLVSGISTGAAVIILGAGTREERHLFGRIDLGVILVELTFIGLLIIDMLNGNAQQQDAIALLLGGDATRLFWVGFIGFGLGVPLLLEWATWRHSIAFVAMLASILVLIGGFLLRDIVLTAGQETGWTHFHNQFNASLLGELRNDGERPDGRF
ncbi:MAG: NrfD/PsrC family molybdoenzyme membrane anchor subunit [Arenicellales bacterium]